MEEWKPVKGYEDLYEVSNLGAVRRISGATAGRILKPVFNGHYWKVSLCRRNQARQLYIHHLVAEAFIGARPEGFQINHRNANKLDNRADNLEYATALANTRHAIENGLWNHAGESNGAAKLTRVKVEMIRRLDGEFSRSQIAQAFGIKPNTISLIVRGVRWVDRNALPDVREIK